MFKIIKSPYPPGIDEAWVKELQKRAKRRREIEAEVRRQMGESYPEPKVSLGRFLLDYQPKSDFDDDLFARHQ